MDRYETLIAEEITNGMSLEMIQKHFDQTMEDYGKHLLINKYGSDIKKAVEAYIKCLCPELPELKTKPEDYIKIIDASIAEVKNKIKEKKVPEERKKGNTIAFNNSGEIDADGILKKFVEKF